MFLLFLTYYDILIYILIHFGFCSKIAQNTVTSIRMLKTRIVDNIILAPLIVLIFVFFLLYNIENI